MNILGLRVPFSWSLLLLAAMLLTSRACGAENNSREVLKGLRSHVLQNLTPGIPPWEGNETSVKVGIIFSPFAINGVDTARESLSIVMSIVLTWRDSTIGWNPEDHGGILLLVVPDAKTWVPDFQVANSLDSFGSITDGASVIIGHDSTFTVEFSDNVNVKCGLDTVRYPYDTQTCCLELVQTAGYGLDLTAQTLNFTRTDNGEWVFVEHDVHVIAVSDVAVRATYRITLRRQNAFYTLQVVFPMALMSCLHALVFLVPVESGEKCSYLMAVFVSHFMFQNLIYTSLPRCSVSRLSVFSVLILVQGVAAIMATVLSLHRHHKASRDSRISPPGQREEVKGASEAGEGGATLEGDLRGGRLHNAEVTKLSALRPSEDLILRGEVPIGFSKNGRVGTWIPVGRRGECLRTAWRDYCLAALFLVLSMLCPVIFFA